MAGIVDVVPYEVEQDAGESLNAVLYPIFDDRYIVLSVGHNPLVDPARTVVMARVEGEMVIIEADTTNKPLVDALVQAGHSLSANCVSLYG